MRIVYILFLFLTSFQLFAFPIPDTKKAIFDIIRKNKVIGIHEIKFFNDVDSLKVETNINIKVKALFIPVYKFSFF